MEGIRTHTMCMRGVFFPFGRRGHFCVCFFTTYSYTIHNILRDDDGYVWVQGAAQRCHAHPKQSKKEIHCFIVYSTTFSVRGIIFFVRKMHFYYVKKKVGLRV